MSDYIPFNKPFLTGKETSYIEDAVKSGKISGNGKYTERCQNYFQNRYHFNRCLLTTSCTDALEMAAILINTEPGDEVIVPSFTFVSSANPFILRGAKIVFADSRPDQPCIDEDRLEKLITVKTKAIVPVHYAGVACDMDKILHLARKYNLFVIEDAAQSIDSFYNDRPLGTLGDLSAFSFHETKNIISGEGGMLVINNKTLMDRAEIIWEKGTNRSAFFKGEVDKYGWVDIGSSFLPSEIIAAFLWAQLESLNSIQTMRKLIWRNYYDLLSDPFFNQRISLPTLPEFATNNAHMFYVKCKNESERAALIAHLKARGIHAVFHYQSLHRSPYFSSQHDNRRLEFADLYSNTLVRLPFFNDLSEDSVAWVVESIRDYYQNI